MTTALSSLAVRETILGVLKAKDKLGAGKIHSSDFRTAVSDLGFPMGSQFVEDLLVHCRLDPVDGSLDFSDLERELDRERRVINTKQQTEKKTFMSSSRAVKEKPWRADVLHLEKLQAEKQSKIVGERRQEVHDIFKQFVTAEADVDTTIQQIKSLGIETTRAFLTLLAHNQVSSEIKFADFTRALVIYDPRNSKSVENDRPAGACHPSRRPQISNVPEVDQGLFTQFRRKNPSASYNPTLTSKEPEKPRTIRKLNLEIDPKSGGISGKFKSSHVIQETVFGQSRGQTLLSHAQLDQQTGCLGAEIPLHYSSELKLLREQVLAALRKLDSGELLLPEFQDKCFEMGFELPEIIIKELRHSAQCGLLDWKKCVEILDAEVFKVRALHDRVLPERVEAAKHALTASLTASGANSLSNLIAAFRNVDTNRDGTLSLNELKAGLVNNGIEADDDDVRILFNAFDLNGDGRLQVSEFVQSIRGRISPPKFRIIRQAFQRLNRTGTPVVALETVVSAYNASVHPDVISGLKSERQVVAEMCVALTAGCADGNVTGPAFDEYFTNLALVEDDDATFIDFVTQSFGIDTRKAPPPLQAITKQGSRSPQVAIPRAKQVHGDCITWDQDFSELETEGEFTEKSRKMYVQHKNKSEHFAVMPTRTRKPVSPEEVAAEFKLLGVSAIHGADRMNRSDKSLLAWNTARRPSSPTRDESSSIPHPADAQYSKTPTKEDARGFLFGNYTWSETKRAHLAKPTPFAVDAKEDPFQPFSLTPGTATVIRSSTSSAPTPRTLADMLATASKQGTAQTSGSSSASKGGKKQPTSLLDLVGDYHGLAQ